MSSEIRHVFGFRVDGDADNLQLILLSDANDELIRYRLTPQIVKKLAIEIPRFATQLANFAMVDGSTILAKLRKEHDATEESRDEIF